MTITLDGASWSVQGEPALAVEGGSRVRWNAQHQDETRDTTSVFVQALGQSYTPDLSGVIAREMELHPRPGQPLSSRTVQAAIDMAAIGQQALAGVDFFTALQFSASSCGVEFRNACHDAGITLASVNAAECQRIDAIMAQHFSHAAAMGAVPVPYATAAQWLSDALHTLKRG